jgi:hypothetical protein
MSSYLLQVLSVAAAWVSLGCAIWIAVRAARWRNSDEAKTLSLRLTAAETEIVGIKVRVDSMPTKSDVEGVRSDLRAMAREIGKVDDAVVRIEQFLLSRPA